MWSFKDVHLAIALTTCVQTDTKRILLDLIIAKNLMQQKTDEEDVIVSAISCHGTISGVISWSHKGKTTVDQNNNANDWNPRGIFRMPMKAPFICFALNRMHTKYVTWETMSCYSCLKYLGSTLPIDQKQY